MSSLAERFEDLRVWQVARTLVGAVYRALIRCTDFGFRDQIQRAVVSVMNNIAEGFERRTTKDFAHYLDIAKGSAGEVRSMLYAAEDLTYIQPETAHSLREDYITLSRSIAALAKSLRAKA